MAPQSVTWPSGATAPCECPHCGHVDAVQVSAARMLDLDFRNSECSECGAGYTVAPTDAGVLVAAMLPRDARSYQIEHHYDVGDQGVTVFAPSLELDVRRVALYIQFCAEEWYGETAMVTNLGIAAALVTFYGCQQSHRNFQGNVIDMHFDREKACGSALVLLADESLRREGLREFLRPHVMVG